MVNKINLSILGFGFMGRVYSCASRILNHFYPDAPAINISSVLVSNSTDRNAISKRYGFPIVTTNLTDIINDKDVNGIYIATPNNFHFEHSILCLKANKNILCEKPMAVTLEQAKTMVQTLEENKDLVANMVFEYRFIPSILKIKEIIQSGGIGQILQFRALYLHGSYAEQRPSSWRLKKGTGGALIDLGPHVFDLINFLIGPIKTLTSKLETKMLNREVDDIAWVFCKTVNNVSGYIEVSRLSTGSIDDLRLEIHGTDGSLRWNLESLNFFEYFSKNSKFPGYQMIPYFTNETDNSDFPPSKVTSGWMMAHVHCLYNFVKQIVDPTFTDERTAHFSDGLMVQRLIEKIKNNEN